MTAPILKMVGTKAYTRLNSPLDLPPGFTGTLDVNYASLPVQAGMTFSQLIRNINSGGGASSLYGNGPIINVNAFSGLVQGQTSGSLYYFTLYHEDYHHGYIVVRNTSSIEILNALGLTSPGNCFVEVDSENDEAQLPVPERPAVLLSHDPITFDTGLNRQLFLVGTRTFSSLNQQLDLEPNFKGTFDINYSSLHVNGGMTLRNVMQAINSPGVYDWAAGPLFLIKAYNNNSIIDSTDTSLKVVLHQRDWHHGYMVIRRSASPEVLTALGFMPDTDVVVGHDYIQAPPKPADLIDIPPSPPFMPVPPKILVITSLKIKQIVKKSPWTADIVMTVLPQRHSNTNINGGKYDGNDVIMGDWIATGSKGRAAKVVMVYQQDDTTVECLIEDYKKLNETMADQTTFLDGSVYQGPGVLFTMDGGVPQLYPLPDEFTTNFTPSYVDQLYSRFILTMSKNRPEEMKFIDCPGLQPNATRQIMLSTGSRIMLTHLSVNVPDVMVECLATLNTYDPDPFRFKSAPDILEDIGIFTVSETDIVVRGSRFVTLLNLDDPFGGETIWKIVNVNPFVPQNIVVTIKYIPY